MQSAKAHPNAIYRRPAQLILKKLGVSVSEYFLYGVLVLIFLTPLVWMVLGSLREEKEIFANLYPFSLRTFVPIKWTLKTYLDMFGISGRG